MTDNAELRELELDLDDLIASNKLEIPYMDTLLLWKCLQQARAEGEAKLKAENSELRKRLEGNAIVYKSKEDNFWCGLANLESDLAKLRASRDKLAAFIAQDGIWARRYNKIKADKQSTVREATSNKIKAIASWIEWSEK